MGRRETVVNADPNAGRVRISNRSAKGFSPPTSAGANALASVVLVYFSDSGNRRDIPLKGETCVVGREEGCDLRIPLSAVSRKHCQFRVQGDQVFLKDLGSSNGTYRNSQQVEGEEIQLAPGDRLGIGSLVLTVRINGLPSQVEPPLLDSPAMAPPKKKATEPATSDAAANDDSDAEIADLIARATKAVNEDSSVFDFEFDLDDE